MTATGSPWSSTRSTELAVVERGVCTFTEKVGNVIAVGGYDAVLVFNRVGSGACNQTLGMSVAGDIAAFGVAPRQQGFAIFGAEGRYHDAEFLAAPAGSVLAPIQVGTHGDTLRFASYFDRWGYVHLFRNQNGKMAELDTYAIPQAHDPASPWGSGTSMHEVATSPQRADLAYFSDYSGGFRVAKIANNQLTEIGHDIDVGANNFWGVQVFTGSDGKEYVAASDLETSGPLGQSSVSVIVGTRLGAGPRLHPHGRAARGRPVAARVQLRLQRRRPKASGRSRASKNNLLPHWLRRYPHHELNDLASTALAANSSAQTPRRTIRSPSLSSTSRPSRWLGCSRSPRTSPTRPPTSSTSSKPPRRCSSGTPPPCAPTPCSCDERRRLTTLILVPDLDMAGARGAAIAALLSLRDPSGVSIIDRFTEPASTKYLHA